MQDKNRDARRMAVLLDIDPVTIANIQQTLIERFDLRIKIACCALLP